MAGALVGRGPELVLLGSSSPSLPLTAAPSSWSANQAWARRRCCRRQRLRLVRERALGGLV